MIGNLSEEIKKYNTFLDHYIKQYPNHANLPVHIIGSTAFLLQNEFKVILKSNNITPGVFYQKLLEGLIELHQK